MAQWSIQGADKKSGREATLLVEAPSPELARQVAKERGMVVSTVKPAHVDDHAEQEPASETSTPPGAAPSAAAVLDYLQQSRPAATRTLTALLWASRACFWLSLLAYAVGGLSLTSALVTVALSLKGPFANSAIDVLRYAVANASSALLPLFGAAAAHVTSTLLLVLRDRLAPQGRDAA